MSTIALNNRLKICYFCSLDLKMETIQNNIYNNIFSSSVDNVKLLLNMLSSSSAQNYNLKVTLRHRDHILGISKSLIDNIKDIGTITVQEYDEIISEIWAPVKSKHDIYYYDYNNNVTKCIKNITKICTPNPNIDINCFFRLNLYTSKNVNYNKDQLSNYLYFERRIGEILEFKNPLLKNWIINCYGVIRTNDKNNKKLITPLKPYEMYTALYLEFKLKDIMGDIKTDLLRLFELFYHKDYQIYSLTYNILNNIYKLDVDKIPETKILTQNDINCKASDALIIKNKFINTCYIAIINNNIYRITRNNIQHLYYEINPKEFGLVSCYICKYDDENNIYYVLDCKIKDGNSVISAYSNRLKLCEEFVKNSSKTDLKFKLCEIVKINSWTEIEEFTDELQSLTYIDIIRNIHFIIYAKTDVIINFLTRRIPYTYKFCLYTITNGKDVINSSLFYNNYSIKHFNYTLTENNNLNNKYAIFDTPYFDNFIVDISLISSEIINSTSFDNNYKNIIKKFVKDIISGAVIIDEKVTQFTIANYHDKYYWIPLPKTSITDNTTEYKQALLASSAIYADYSYIDQESITNANQLVISLVNRFMVEEFISNFPHTNVIDVFDGFNYFISELYLIGYIKNIISINNDKYNIINYINTILNDKNTKHYDLMKINTKNDIIRYPINLKCLKYNIQNINNNIYNKLLSISIFNINNFDVFIMSDNSNKFFTSIIKTFKLFNLLEYVLNKHGRLIIKFIDYDINNIIDSKFKPYYISKKAYEHDKYITCINNELRYKGNTYYIDDIDNISLGPLYSIIAYNNCQNIPILPIDKITLYKLCEIFSIDIQFHATIYTRIIKNYVGICDFDKCLGGMSEKIFNNNEPNSNILIAENFLSECSINLINYRIEKQYKEFLTLVVTNDQRAVDISGLTKISEHVYIVLPTSISKKYLSILINLKIEDYCNRFRYVDGKIYMTIRDLIYDLFISCNYNVDRVIMPCHDTFFMNYCKSIDRDCLTNLPLELKEITIASFNKIK